MKTLFVLDFSGFNFPSGQVSNLAWAIEVTLEFAFPKSICENTCFFNWYKI